MHSEHRLCKKEVTCWCWILTFFVAEAIYCNKIDNIQFWVLDGIFFLNTKTKLKCSRSMRSLKLISNISRKGIFSSKFFGEIQIYDSISIIYNKNSIKLLKTKNIYFSDFFLIPNILITFDYFIKFLQICVMDGEHVGISPIIGSCIIGSAIGVCNSEESTSASGNNPSHDHWLDIIRSPRKTFTYWHKLM